MKLPTRLLRRAAELSRVPLLVLLLFSLGHAADNKKPAPPAATPAEEEADAGKTRDITFDDIKFDAEKGQAFERSQITPAIEALHGKRIKVRGWILPTSVFKNKGIKRFVLVRDDMECCFGPNAALYDCIIVEMTPGNSCSFSTQAVAVEGKFAIDVLADPFDETARPQAVYRLDADAVE